MELTKSKVMFNEVEHTYTLDGVTLNGVTKMIRHQIFRDDSVPPAFVFANGKTIHQEIQDRFFGLGDDNPSPEYLAMKDVCDASGISFIESEFVVSDNKYWASAIDLIGSDLTLYDIKTNKSGIDKLYVRWQLSIYKYLLKIQCGVDAPAIKCIWLTDGKCEVIDIDPIDEARVVSLLKFASEGREYSSSIDLLCQELHALSVEKKNIDDRIESLKSSIIDLMKSEGLNGWKNEGCTMSYVGASTSQTFDSKRFKEENENLYNMYVKESKRKESLTVKLK